jgi:hypothetical protein
MAVSSVLQIILAMGLFNVWLVRPAKQTAYRGSEAKSLKEEFEVYGLPTWFFKLVGTLKMTAALGLLIGLYLPQVALVSAALLTLLMLGALVMHIKVKDPLLKSVPAFLMLGMSLAVLAIGSQVL